MKFSMKKHDISLVAIIARQAERTERDLMLLSSVDCFRMLLVVTPSQADSESLARWQ